MAESLLELLPWLNQRDEAEIRRATVYSLAAIAAVSPELIHSWRPWIEAAALEDPDEIVRAISQKLLQ